METIYNFAKRDLQSLLGVIDGCLKADSTAKLVSVLDLLQRTIPFERATICQVSPSSRDSGFFSNLINHSYDRIWINSYLTNSYHTVDPVIGRALRCDSPVSWTSVLSAPTPGARGRNFLEEAREYGLLNGVTCMTRAGQHHHRTLLSLSLPRKLKSESYSAVVQTATAHLHEALVRLDRCHGVKTTTSSETVTLTSRESEVLKWASIGKTCWEIGKILNITERTVKFHLGNIFMKLNVVNRSQAVAKALRLGLISP